MVCEKLIGGKKEEKMTTIVTRATRNVTSKFPTINFDVIEDAVSNAMVQFVKYKKDITNPIGFVTTSAIHFIQSHLRSLDKTVHLNFDVYSQELSPLDKLIRNEEMNLLQSALKKLPIKDRRFLLNYYDTMFNYGKRRKKSDWMRATRIRRKVKGFLTKTSADCP